MKRHLLVTALVTLVGLVGIQALPATGQWMTRDHRWQLRGPWNWAVPRELPALFREFNGIDFGHAHLAETLLRTQDPNRVEKARLEVSISSSARRRCAEACRQIAGGTAFRQAA